MKQILKKMIFFALVLTVSASLFCGCNDKLDDAENVVQVYLTAVTGFNTDAMESCLSEGTNKDFGVDTSVVESDYVQTDAYKKAVESMFKGLSDTIEFEINSSRKEADNTALVNVTVRAADVNQEAVDAYMEAKMAEYVQTHPELLEKTELEQNNTGIQVMAETYNEFVKLQPKAEESFDITLVEIDGSWKILNNAANKPLMNWLTRVYGTF